MSAWSKKRIQAATEWQTFLRVLPTRWRRKPGSIDIERHYLTVTLCIGSFYANKNWPDHLWLSRGTPVAGGMFSTGLSVCACVQACLPGRRRSPTGLCRRHLQLVVSTVQRWTRVHFSSSNPTHDANTKTSQPNPSITYVREMQTPVL